MAEMTRKKRFVRVAAAGEVPPGAVRAFDVEGTAILLCNVDGALHAIENVCTHDDAPLGRGRLLGAAIECPRHGARFDVRTGAVLRMPAVAPVRCFPVRTEGADILVEVEE